MNNIHKIITDDQIKLFLKELSKLSKKHHIYIGGCGCCGSPYLIASKEYVFKDGYDISCYENLGGNDENGYSVEYNGEYIKGE